MAQRLLISLRKNIIPRDAVFHCVYDEKSAVGDLLRDWMRYSDINQVHIGPLKICVRDWIFFDKFMEDFLKIKGFCPRVSSFDDVWTVQDLTTLKIIHVSPKEDKHFGGLYGSVIRSLENPDDPFTNKNTKDL